MKTANILYKFILLFFIGFSISARSAETDSIDIYLHQQNDLKALRYAISHSDKLLNQRKYKEYCEANIKKSKIYRKLKDQKKAINTLYTTLQIAEKNKLPFEQVLILNEIAKTFQESQNKTKAIRYFKKGEQIAIRLNNDTLRGFIDQGLFSTYLGEKSRDSAKIYMKFIMNIHKDKGNSDQIYRAYSNYSNYYFSFDDEALGKKYLDTAFYYAKKNSKVKYLTTCYMNLGYYYLAVVQDFKKGEQQYLNILALTPNDSTSTNASDCFLNLSYAYEQMQDFKKANKYLNKYIENTSAIYQNKINSQLKDTETKYEIDKVESEYKKKQLELEEKQLKNQKIFLVIIALMFLISILFYFFYQNIRLKEKNKLKDIESKIQQNIINATIDGQENERKKIAGVLHDNISAQLSSAGLHLSAFSAITNTNSEEIAKTRAILKEAHDKVRDLSHELLPVLLAKFGMLYALQDLCEKNSNSLIEFEFSSNITMLKRYNEEFEMKLYFIITELLNNIIKHSQASAAKLTVNENNAHLEIAITDNGIGFNSLKIKSEEGFGLTQIRARILKMKGDFTIESKPHQGAAIFIKVPVEA